MSDKVIAQMTDLNASVMKRLDTIGEKLEGVARLETSMKALLKLVRKIARVQDDPTGEKAEKRKANNGFKKQQKVTPDMAKFLGLKDKEPTASRSEVTTAIYAYVREKNLKDPENKRHIVLDKTLSKLLDPPTGEDVTNTNIQRYLSKHFIK